jgi:hypothetical protein
VRSIKEETYLDDEVDDCEVFDEFENRGGHVRQESGEDDLDMIDENVMAKPMPSHAL